MDSALDLKKFQRQKGMLIVLSGPSGVGKGTVLERLLDLCPDTERAITCTTREPRPGEVNGVDYCFMSKQEFEDRIEAGDFLEYAIVHSNHYGTPRSEVERILSKGKDAFLEIDVQGGLTVKGKHPEAITIFIAPPSIEELGRRLRGRGTDTEEVIQRRLRNAEKEMAETPHYDYLVLNDNLDEAVDRLRCIIMAERSRVQKGATRNG